MHELPVTAFAAAGGRSAFITVLELPPVDSAPSAVKVGVAYQIKKRIT